MKIELRHYATTYGIGPFFPAIRDGKDVWYWRQEFIREDDAYEYANGIVQEARRAAQAVVDNWDIVKA